MTILLTGLICFFFSRIVGGERFGLEVIEHKKTLRLVIPLIEYEVFSYTVEWQTGYGGYLGYLGKFGWGFTLGFAVTGDVVIATYTSLAWKFGEQWSFFKRFNFGTLFDQLSGITPANKYLFFDFCGRAAIWCQWTIYLAVLTGEYDLLILCTYVVMFPISAWLGYRVNKWFNKHEAYEFLRGGIHGVLTAAA